MKAVVFDLDGTLLDTMTSVPTAYADTIRGLGGPDVTPAEVVAAWHVGPTPVVLAHFLGRPISPEDTECFFGHLAAAAAAVRPFAGVPEMLDDLRHSGYRLGVYTSATRRGAALMLAAAGLNGGFAALVGGDEVSAPKPDPVGLHLACWRLTVDAGQAGYVGDTEVDVRCAQAAGSLAIHARWAATSVAVPGGHRVARHPHEVITVLSGL